MTTTNRLESSKEAPLVAGLTRIQMARALVLVAAFLSFLFSVSLWFFGNESEGVFVGIWVPSILSLGAFLLPRSVDRG